MKTLNISSESLLVQIENLNSQNISLKNQVEYLTQQIEWFKRQIFGSKSERIIEHNPNEIQLTFFDLGEKKQPEEKTNVKSFKRSKSDSNQSKTAITFPEDLPVERTVLDINEEDKICKITGKPLVKIGEDVSQKLAFKSGSFFIKEIIRPKYAAPKGTEEAIFVANLPESLLPRCVAHESLLAEILVKKFSDHLPLYRQSEIFSRDNVHINRQVMSQWVIKSGLALKPLYEELKKEILKGQNVFIDEVPVNMLSPGKGKAHKAYMWVMVGGKSSNPALRVYNFRKNRSYQHAENLLSNFKNGVVHSDKYGAYETLASKKYFNWCPCWAHIRRIFLEAEGGDSNFTQYILRKIKYLFMYERVAWKRSEEERLKIRKEKEVPIIDNLICLIKEKYINGKVIPKSKYKEALGYFLGLVPYLKNYTLYPYARLDNNVAERAVRPLALGRKNWLFLGNEWGGEAAAIILSLIQTCKALGVNPRDYLSDVMARIMSWNSSKISELLPHNWVKSI